MRTFILMFFIVQVTYLPGEANLFGQSHEIEQAFTSGFNRPLAAVHSHADSDHLYVVRKGGEIYRINVLEPAAGAELWFDIKDQITDPGESGLLGLAFHPDYPVNNTFYIYYSHDENGQLQSRISRFYVSNGQANEDSEEILLQFDQPNSQHNGGTLHFGPDGYLYIASGDGTSRITDDSQDNSNYFGTILRIDVNTDTGYTVPADNPFVGNEEGLDEIYAWGFRNPWKFSFDSVTGHLWLADVGETEMESIYVVEKGKNYGWPIVEGSVCFEGSDCDKTGLEMPIYEYEWDENYGRSVTGGYVYRGSNNPSLYGKYVYGDFITGKIWALSVDHENLEVLGNEELIDTDLMIPSFGIDGRNELYILSYGSDGRLFRFVPEEVSTTIILSGSPSNNAIELTWEVNSLAGIDEFRIYRGESPGELELLTTVSANNSSYTDENLIDGSSFYAVTSVKSGSESSLSNGVSYYHSALSIVNQWEMISIPFETNGINLTNTTVYGFDGTYNLEENLVSGQGYLVRSYDGETVELEGMGIGEISLDLNQGWNIIGGLVDNIDITAIADPGGILNTTPIYTLNGAVYQEVQQLLPGAGYWIFAENTGEISYQMSEFSKADHTIPEESISANYNENTEPSDKLIFSSGDYNYEVIVSMVNLETELRNRYRMPPLAPEPILDVRTSDGYRVIEGNDNELILNAASYPIGVRFEQDNDSPIDGFRLVLEKDGSSEFINLQPGRQQFILGDYDRIFLEMIQENETEHITELDPVYPNPFNNSTNIRYRLADQTLVKMEVYDVSGRKVATIVNEIQNSGSHTERFDVSNLASGVYFLHMQAGNYSVVRKLTLIK